jgi:hypothetical protein
MDSSYNYFDQFHGLLWKYFVEFPSYVDSYRETFGADNCVAVGSMHLDPYMAGGQPGPVPWKDPEGNKKRVVYAPHFSMGNSHMTATFAKNWQFMFNLASMNPQTTWAIRPHPSFEQGVVSSGLMAKWDLEDYYRQWEKYGIVVRDGNYIDLFRTSDCLLTDCISALADYLPTGRPVFHLRDERQTVDFNAIGTRIIGSYYQVHSNVELYKLFSRVMVDGDDFLGEARRKCLEDLGLMAGKMASMRVFEHLEAEFGLR